MPKRRDILLSTGPDPGTGERVRSTCAHCNRVVVVKPMMRAEDMGGICHLCGDNNVRLFVCSNCAGKPCEPFEEKINAGKRQPVVPYKSFGSLPR